MPLPDWARGAVWPFHPTTSAAQDKPLSRQTMPNHATSIEEGGGVEPLPLPDTTVFKTACGPTHGTFHCSEAGIRTRTCTVVHQDVRPVRLPVSPPLAPAD